MTSQSKPFIPADKQLHLAAGSAIALSTCIGMQFLNDSQKGAVFTSTLLATAAAVGRESYGVKRGAKFDYNDIAFTVVSAFVVSKAINLISKRKDRRALNKSEKLF